MKKLLFTAYDMNIGGIERALVSLLSKFDYSKYEVTLYLEKLDGPLLKEIPKEVIVKEYKLSTLKFTLFRKIVNRLKLLRTIVFSYNRYDFACCYATYSIPCSKIARFSSKNNLLWVHSNYCSLYEGNLNEIKKFFNSVLATRFKRLVFLTEEAKKDFLGVFPSSESKCFISGNVVEKEKIIELANDKINELKPSRKLFINISRHEDKSKKLGRLIEACKMLKDEGLDFEVWLIGDGPSNKEYRERVINLGIDDIVRFFGMKNNPYPYYKVADCFVMTSDYEGFPVAYIESLIFKIPIISTVRLTNRNIKMDNSSIIVEKNSKSVYEAMKNVITNKVKFKFDFDANIYNNKIIEMIDMFIDDEV